MTYIAEYFRKSFFKSNSFLTDIWNETVSDHLLVINDFVENKSHDSSSITIEEVRRICSINAQCSRRQPYKEDTEHESECPNIIKQNNILPHETTSPQYDALMFIHPWTPETLITDALLDSFDIPPGKKGVRLVKFYKNSVIMYDYLCYYIGSERTVKFRRLYIKKIYPSNPWIGITMDFCGSTAEGLDMKGSDIDLVVIYDLFGAAVEHTTPSSQQGGFFRIQFEFSNMSPGYVFVELIMFGKRVPLPSSHMKNWTSKMFHYAKCIFSTIKHGPAISHKFFGIDVDHVPAFKMETWPKIANEWIIRKRKFGWPSQEMINDVVKRGCLIVPVGNRANDSEWRLSFTQAEKDLIFSFNHTQLLVYGLLKLILKEIVNPDKEVSELLCSYYLKTTLFWIIEETHASVWKPRMILLCFYLSLERLIQFIVEEKCPNYFVRKNNMFSGRFPNLSEKNKLLNILCKISGSGLSWILESKTMSKLKSFIEVPSQTLKLGGLQKRKNFWEVIRNIGALIDVSKFYASLLFDSKSIVYARLLKSLLQVPIFRKSAYQVTCHLIDYLDRDNKQNDNRKIYSLEKMQLFLLCAGCKSDLVVGKLLLASWFYKHGKFIESLEFADMAFEFNKHIVPHYSVDTTKEFTDNFHPKIDCASEVDFIENATRFIKSNITFYKNSCLLPREIKCVLRAIQIGFTAYVDPLNLPFTVLPENYYHFLRFACLYKLGEIQLSHEELTAIHSVDPHNSVLRITGNMIKYRTENEWINHTKPVSPCNFEGIQSISKLTKLYQHFECNKDIFNPDFFQAVMEPFYVFCNIYGANRVRF